MIEIDRFEAGGSPLIVPFPGTERTTRNDVGGKAASLIQMSDAGFPVPPGLVLTTAFFAPLFDEVSASATWRNLIEARFVINPDKLAYLGYPLADLARTNAAGWSA